MTPTEFIDAVFGKGWTESQLPLFVVMLKQMEDDAKRYHEVREVMAAGNASYVADRKALYEIDSLVDQARNRGLL